MIIAAHSNVVSGLYFIVFETLLPLLLGLSLQILISAHNLHALHNRKQTLNLTTTRLSHLFDHGITTRKHARLISLLGGSILVLTTIGSFSIDGRSRPETTFGTAQIFFTPTMNENDLIDFTQHVSTDGTTVSALFLLARDASDCASTNGNTDTIFSAVASYGDDINVISHSRNTILSNVSCAYERNGFVNGKTFLKHHRFLNRSFVTECEYSGIETIRESSIWQENTTITCEHMEAMETWCAKYVNFACITQARLDVGYSFLLRIFESAVPVLPVFFGTTYTEQAAHRRMMKSYAYMLATGVDYRTGTMETMSRLSISRNVSVEMKSGEVLETEVFVWLFTCTAGVATVITLIVCLWTALRWRTCVVKRELKDRNSLSGAMGVMLLAAAAARDQRGEEEKIGDDDEVVIGVSACEGRGMRVRPLSARETEWSKVDFEEQNVDGRWRRRKHVEVSAVQQR